MTKTKRIKPEKNDNILRIIDLNLIENVRNNTVSPSKYTIFGPHLVLPTPSYQFCTWPTDIQQYYYSFYINLGLG